MYLFRTNPKPTLACRVCQLPYKGPANDPCSRHFEGAVEGSIQTMCCTPECTNMVIWGSPSAISTMSLFCTGCHLKERKSPMSEARKSHVEAVHQNYRVPNVCKYPDCVLETNRSGSNGKGAYNRYCAGHKGLRPFAPTRKKESFPGIRDMLDGIMRELQIEGSEADTAHIKLLLNYDGSWKLESTPVLSKGIRT